MTKNAIIFLFLLSCAVISVTAEEAVLSYIGGKEIVIYTPDFRLIPFEELIKGDPVPPGSVIETGIRSSCELSLGGGRTGIKLDDKTTFKIESVRTSGETGGLTFKLIEGTCRVVTGPETRSVPSRFICGTSICTASRADFGMTVKRGKEESVFVLKGECFFSNSRGEIITVTEDRMADSYGGQFRSVPLSDRYRFLAGRLVFESAIKDPFTGNTIPLSPEAETTPLPTAPPGVEAVGEPTPPSPEGAAAFEKTKTGSSDKGSPDTPSIKDKPPEKREFIVSDVENGTLIVVIEEEKSGAGYDLNEIYNLYEQIIRTGDQTRYSGFIDSVYLKAIEKNRLVFSFLKERASANGKKGYILSPTGQLYEPKSVPVTTEPEHKADETVPEASSEETAAEAVPEAPAEETVSETEPEIIEADEISETVPKTEKTISSHSRPLFNIGMGASLSMGFFDTPDWGSYPINISLLLMLLSSRVNYYADVLLNFLPFLGVGIEAGCAFMTWKEENLDIEVLFLDVPVRGFLRFGGGGTFIQVYGGYYFCVMGSALDGLDMGVKISLGGFIIEGSYIVTDIENFFSPSSYFRAAIGWSWNDILGK
ncbi:MAG: hypothetical protein JW881_18320 [Spirochaetales bacterium]|nr:hypothetical protein [Spirochaetales bacterium]